MNLRLGTMTVTKLPEDVLIRADGVSKRFCRSLRRSLWYGLLDIASEFTRPQSTSNPAIKGLSALRRDEFWAVKDVSFELRRGECLGLIGRNGAGKTTLLRMLNGLIKPDGGRIEIRGRVVALISLGAGFNPILTGRENVYVNGSVLGLAKREIDDKIEDIIDFADIREFIDTPVQSYSSGMQVRLGFAVATALEPDVLLLDEVLAVGDAAFRNKCYRRITSLRKKAAVIFVTHSMEQMSRICDESLVLSKGAVAFLGSVSEGVKAYERLNDGDDNGNDAFVSLALPVTDFAYETDPSRLTSGDVMSLRLHCRAAAAIQQFLFRITLYNSSGAVAADCNFSSTQYGIELREGENAWTMRLAPIALRSGCYRMSINIVASSGEFLVWSHKQSTFTVEGGFAGAAADYQLQLQEWKPRTGFEATQPHDAARS